MAAPAKAQVRNSDDTSNKSFACGIDIGTKNLSISFVSLDDKRQVISYKGTMELMSRYEEGVDTQEFEISGRKLSNHDVYIAILETLPEFKDTVSTVIEMQLAMNKSDMSRLDGVAYGFLRGRFPSMMVNLNGSTIRTKFIANEIAPYETRDVLLPRGYPATKTPSFLFVGCIYPSHYAYIRAEPSINKIDDICDSTVYASIAAANWEGTRTTRGRRR